MSYFLLPMTGVALYPGVAGGIVMTASCLRQFVTLTRETLGLWELESGECRAVLSFICRDQNKINQLSLIVHFQPLDTMPTLATACPSKSLQTYDLI